jgi:hypothetical protein
MDDALVGIYWVDMLLNIVLLCSLFLNTEYYFVKIYLYKINTKITKIYVILAQK